MVGPRRIVLGACTLLLTAGGMFTPAVGHEPPQSAQCICETAVIRNGWCTRCNRGFVASLEIRSSDLYDMIDPHGHDMDLAHLPCSGCVTASRTDGFCDATQVGFVDGRGYVSRMAYLVARAENLETRGLGCGLCRDHLESPGWCSRCHRGMIGHFSFHRREDFRRAEKEYRRLQAAIDRTAQCELCAIALFADGRCPNCNLRYKDGIRLETGDVHSSSERGTIQ